MQLVLVRFWQLTCTHANFGSVRALKHQPAVSQLRSSATRGEIEAVARDAVEPIGQEFKHQEACDLMTRRLCVPGATYHEQQEAKESVRTALLKLRLAVTQPWKCNES